MRLATWAAVSTTALAAWACAPASDTGSGPPLNVVVILSDDMGWVDTGAYGSESYETPAIDRLTSEGARFTQFYTASPVCSPTRASIMTGKHPARLHITDWIGGNRSGKLLPAEYERALPLDEVTFGEAFQEAGYTTGYVGTWHLGDEPYLPEQQGFEQTVVVNHAAEPGSYFYPYRSESWPEADVPDLEDGDTGENLTNRLTDEAITFLEANRDRPFLFVLSHYSVHTPLQAKDAMIESTDQSVGRIMAKLEELGIEDRTAVVFLSDNGGLSTLMRSRNTMPTSNAPLRAGKGWLYEGGIRAPLIVKWPGVAQAGIAIDALTTTMDLFPTLLDMIDAPLRPADHVDGVSLTPALRGSALPDRGPLYWHFPHYHGAGGRPSAAIRSGRFKLIEWFEDGAVELYDIEADIGEAENLASERPREVQELRVLLQAWRDEVDARMPFPNPEWVEGR